MLVTWLIEWPKGRMPHRCTLRNLAHRAWALWDFSNHDLLWIIPNPGSQKRVILSLESIFTITFQAWASDVKMPKLRHHSSNCRMPCFVNAFGTFQWRWDQPNENPGGHFRCLADMVLNISNCDIHQLGMLIAWKIGQVSLDRCTNDWANCHSGRKLIFCSPPPIGSVYRAVDSMSLRDREAHQFEIEVCLKWTMH